MSGSLFGVAFPLVQQRETGIAAPAARHTGAGRGGGDCARCDLGCDRVAVVDRPDDPGAADLRHADGGLMAVADRRLLVRGVRAGADRPAGRQHGARHQDRAGDCQPAVLPVDVPVGLGVSIRDAPRRREAIRARVADDLSQRIVCGGDRRRRKHLADGRHARRARRHRRDRHRPDVDAVPMGRHGSDSAAIARDDRRRVRA